MHHYTGHYEHEDYEHARQYLGRLLIDLPGFSLDWTLRQDMRDMRRFRAVDLSGVTHEHCAPAEMLRRVALIVPHYGSARRFVSI